MFNTNLVQQILGDTQLEDKTRVADHFKNGTMFALRIDEQSKQATFYYLEGKKVRRATLELDRKRIEALKDLMRMRQTTHMRRRFITCGDVYIRPDMVAELKAADGYRPDPVHWSKHKDPFVADVTFVLKASGAEVTMRGIHHGATIPFNNAGYHVIPRTRALRHFTIEKAKADDQPLLQLDPNLPNHERSRFAITTGSTSTNNITQLPRQFMPI